MFPAYFAILNMLEDSETPLLLEMSFLETGKALFDVALGELILRFSEENFSSMCLKHHKENPQCYQVSMVKEKLKIAIWK